MHLNEQVNPLSLTISRFQEMALECANNNDHSEFLKVMKMLVGRPDYLLAEMAMCDILLRHDELAMYNKSFQVSYLAKWCKDNAEHVVHHCPRVLDCWRFRSGTREASVLTSIAKVHETLDHESLKIIIQGQGDMESHKIIYELLLANPRHWACLSPIWIGAPESALRVAATQLGWSEKILPIMVHKSFWDSNALNWLPNVPYPYSLMACREYYQATQLWNKTTTTVPEKVIAQEQARPNDVALAKIILGNCPPNVGFSIGRPRGMARVNEHTMGILDGSVRAHIALDAMSNLELQLAKGEMPGLLLPTSFDTTGFEL